MESKRAVSTATAGEERENHAIAEEVKIGGRRLEDAKNVVGRQRDNKPVGLGAKRTRISSPFSAEFADEFVLQHRMSATFGHFCAIIRCRCLGVLGTIILSRESPSK